MSSLINSLLIVIFVFGLSISTYSQCTSFTGPPDLEVEDNDVLSDQKNLTPGSVAAGDSLTVNFTSADEGPCELDPDLYAVHADGSLQLIVSLGPTGTTFSGSILATEEIVALRLVSNRDPNPCPPDPDDSFYNINFGVICTTPSCPPAPTGSGGSGSVCGGAAFTFPSRTCASGTLRWYENSGGTGTFHTGASVTPSSTTTYHPFCFTTCLSPVGTSATATVTCFPTTPTASGVYTWTGCQNTDWFNPCNWDTGALPTTAKDVIIPNVTNDPTISGGTANCDEITIQTGGIVNLVSTSSGVLNVTKP